MPPERDVAVLVNSLIKTSLDTNLISERDVVTIVHGFLPGVSGTTNTIQVLDIREYLASTWEDNAVEIAATTPSPSGA